MSVSLRRATVADANAIAVIHHAAVQQTAAPFYPPDVLNAWSGPPRGEGSPRVRELIGSDDELFVVAEEGGAVVGFASVFVPDEQLRAVYVHPAAGRRGIGGRLLQEVEQLAIAKGLRRLSMDASLNAERFYVNAGYEVVERGVHRFRSGIEMACVKMRKDLPPVPSARATPPIIDLDSRHLTPDQIHAIVALVYRIWPSTTRSFDEVVANFQTRQQHIGIVNPLSHQPPLRHILWEGDEVIAHALSFERPIHTSVGTFPVMALAAVAVHPDRRGKGLGRAVVERAFERVDRGKFSVSLFQTGVRAFYEKFGAISVANEIVNSQGPDGPRTPAWRDPGIMIYPSTYPWPEGTIDLMGEGH